MGICHVAIYTRDLERLKDFYTKYFHGVAGDYFHEKNGDFSSYFIDFGTGVNLEIMTKDSGLNDIERVDGNVGYSHMAIAVGDKETVDNLTAKIKEDGYTVVGGPRVTEDHYYESCVLDPDGNRVEITCG